MNWAIGVDVGGTFTDFCALEIATGKTRIWKRPSTPERPAAAIIAGVKELASAYNIPLDKVVRLAHGTTVATNALIQRKGGSVALVTTKGFRDLVEIGRQVRPHLYDLQRDYPAPLAPRRHRLEVGERINAAGEILIPINLADLDDVIAGVKKLNVDAVAICFLFGYLNPKHEMIAAEKFRAALPNVEVCASSEVQPEFREYERFTTTIINAYLQPVLADYMNELESELAELLPNAVLGVNQSSGGLMTIPRTKSFPVRTALSGPAAGAVGALHIIASAGREDALTIDVGGTSADVAMIKGSKLDVSYGRDVDGFPIRLPMIDIQTVGAGGGSIAWFDKDGLLKMGPASAGASPGPACYGRGGVEPTLSDANLILGRLSPSLLNGAMRLDRDLAYAAVRKIATPMGKSVEDAALGMIAVSVSNMVRAIRTMSVERGHDPRDFALVPFGGAGPMHARDIAVAMSMKEIVIPLAPGIVCAQGLVIAELKEDFVGGSRAPLDHTTPRIARDIVTQLVDRAKEWAKSETVDLSELVGDLMFEMRYVGQNFELSVPIASGSILTFQQIPSVDELRRRFFEVHDRAYSFHDPVAKVEFVHARLSVRAPLSRKAAPVEKQRERAGAGPKQAGKRTVYFSSLPSEMVPVYPRDTLTAGHSLIGPAVIEQVDTSIPIYPGDKVTVHESGNLIIDLAQ
jgi:N-methylhydantoinase A